MLPLLIYPCAALLLTLALMSLFFRVAQGLGLVDRPNQRSSHQLPTVKGGGLVFSSVYLLTVSYLYFFVPGYKSVAAVVLIVCPHVLIIGWLDDRFNLSAKLRLVLHLLLSAFIVGLLANGFDLQMTFLFLPAVGWLNLVFSILFITWFTNLYNFMDGADGMAGATGVVGALGMCFLSYQQGSLPLATVYAVIGFAVLGFLRWNWQPARLFMGESGSYFLGINFATLALIGRFKFDLPLYPTVILFGLFIVDPTYTLVVRVWRRQNPLQAHQHFAFHKLLKRGWSHGRAATLYALVALCWLFPLAYGALLYQDYAFTLLVVSYMPLLCYTIFVKAGID